MFKNLRSTALKAAVLLTVSGSAFAAEGDTDIVTQLVGTIDKSTLIGAVVTVGGIVLAVKYGEKGIAIAKRLTGKI